MYDISLIDETFDINLSSNYHLSIQIGRKSFTYCILDSVRNKYIALKHFYFGDDIPVNALIETVKEILKGEEYLTKKYKSINAVFVSNKSILIPKPLFQEDNLSNYFKLNHTLNNNEEIICNKLKNIDAYLVFSIYKELKTHLSKCFTGIKFYHQANTLIDNNLMTYKNKLSLPSVFLNLSNDLFDIVVLEKNKLIFYNAFSFNEQNDFIYYLMNVYEQLNLNPESTELIISGEISKLSEHYKNIKKFIKLIKFSKLADSYSCSYKFNEVPGHRFSNLLNLARCV